MKTHLNIALIWFSAMTIFSLPFFAFGMDFPTAFLESASALTSVGITSVVRGNPLYFYHAFLAFVGGILFLATLPYLISTSDSFKFAIHDNLAIKKFIYAYIYIFIFGVILYFAFGENPIDSVVLSALSVSTAGAIYISDNLIIPASVLMFLSVIFPLIYILTDLKTNIISIGKREQFRFFAIIFLFAFIYLILNNIPPDSAIFYILSFASTTGFITEDFYSFKNHSLYILFILSFMGGLIGCVGGGVKIFRLIILFRIFFTELKRVLNPRMVTVIKLNNFSAPSKIIGKVLIFFFLYTSVIFAFSMIFALFGIEYANAAAISFSLLTTVGILPFELREIIFNSNYFLKIITAFFFMIVRLKIFIFFILAQYFFEKIKNMGVHSWKRK